MSFITGGSVRANPFVLEIIETGQGATSIGGGVPTEERIAALESAVANLQAIITAIAGGGVVIGSDSATFTNVSGTNYSMTVGGSVTITGDLVVRGTITN
jgi:hypothetical protein